MIMTRLSKRGLSVSIASWEKGANAPFLASSGLATKNPFGGSAQPVDYSSTLFSAASISKLFLGTLVLQCVELKEILLDGDISNYLPGPYRNPLFPDHPITPRMLLSHKSSLCDSEGALRSGSCFCTVLKTVDDFCPMSLEEYFNHPLSPSKHFSDQPPGSEPSYSNAGFTILGLAVQTATKQPLAELLKKRIFEPLGLHYSCFCFQDFWKMESASIAIPQTGGSPRLYEVAEWPAAGLRASAGDIIKFLSSFHAETSPILKPESIALMLPADGKQGLAWWGSEFLYHSARTNEKGCLAWEHGGLMEGIRSYAFLYPDRAIVLLVNGDADLMWLQKTLCELWRPKV